MEAALASDIGEDTLASLLGCFRPFLAQRPSYLRLLSETWLASSCFQRLLPFPAGLLQAQRSQRDGRTHVHTTPDVQTDPETEAGAAEIRRTADFPGGGKSAGVRGTVPWSLGGKLQATPPGKSGCLVQTWVCMT